MTTPQTPFPSRRYLRHGMLPQLAAFEAVVRLGSATRAAEALCVAQPTLSGQLRKLSEALGVRLFSLHGKRLVPTDAARVLLQTTHEVFAALDRCEPVLACLRASAAPSFVASGLVPVPVPVVTAAAPAAREGCADRADRAGPGGHAAPAAGAGRAADPAEASARTVPRPRPPPTAPRQAPPLRRVPPPTPPPARAHRPEPAAIAGVD